MSNAFETPTSAASESESPTSQTVSSNREALRGMSYADQMASLSPAAAGQGIIQRHVGGAAQAQGGQAPAASGGGAGLAPGLRAGIEQLGGVSMEDVRVHRNSAQAAHYGAEAFTQGPNIHVGPGHDKHIPHEAWHVVQQKRGRVSATSQVNGAPLNDDPGLEAEADRMGEQAAALGGTGVGHGAAAAPVASGPALSSSGPIQRKIGFEFETGVLVRTPEDRRQPIQPDGTGGAWLSKGDSLKKKKGMDMQVDTNPITGSNIEFVSDAFDFSPAGKRAMFKSLDQMDSWVGSLSSKAKQGDDGLEFRKLNKAISGVAPADTQFKPEYRRISGNPQISVGLAPDELQGILEAFHRSRNSRGTAETGYDSRVNALFQAVTGSPDDYAQIVEELAALKRRDLANPAVGEAPPERVADPDEDLSPSLKGIVWIMASYLKTIDNDTQTRRGLPFANSKEVTAALSRNNIAALVSTLEHSEKMLLWLKPHLLVNAVAKAGGFDMSQKIYPHGFLKGADRHTVDFGLTRQDWALGVAQGRDKLTKEYWETLPDTAPDAGDKDDGKQLHKSLGGYGRGMDTDRGYKQAVFEFRKIQGGRSVDDFRTVLSNAWDVFEEKMRGDD